MQVAKLDMTNSSHQCPDGTRLRTDLPSSHNKLLCGIDHDGAACSSTTFNTHNIAYTQACGKIIAYQYSTTDAFGVRTPTTLINGSYVDGISLTHGRNPQKHIWTFAAALDKVETFSELNCPCTNINKSPEATQPPSFVGNEYFCDTASENRFDFIFYANDPYGMELVVD